MVTAKIFYKIALTLFCLSAFASFLFLENGFEIKPPVTLLQDSELYINPVKRNFEISTSKHGWKTFNYNKMETNFIKIPERELIVWSAFFDNRSVDVVKAEIKSPWGRGFVQPWKVKRRPVVVLTGLSARKLRSTFCHVYYAKTSFNERGKIGNGLTKSVSEMKMSKYRQMYKNYKNKWMTIWRNNLFVCDVNRDIVNPGNPKIPVLVGLSPQNTTLPREFLSVEPFSDAKPNDSIAVCVSTIYGNLSTVDFAEFMEFYRDMGINNFYLYGAVNITEELSKLLTWYENRGILEYIPWRVPYGDQRFPINASQDHFDNHIQKSGSTDCIYRNHGRHKWTLHVDIDEFIIPKLDWTIQEVISRVSKQNNYPKKVSSLRFLHVQFCTDTLFNNKTVKNDSAFDLRIDRFKLSSKPWPIRVGHGNRGKFLSNPSAVEFVGSHMVTLALKDYKEVHVDPSIAALHHYRKPLLQPTHYNCNRINTDAQKYVEKLRPRVKYVLNNYIN